MKKITSLLLVLTGICTVMLITTSCNNAITSTDTTAPPTTVLNCEHTYSHVTTEPTDKNQGYTTHTCNKCGHSYIDTYTDPLKSISLQFDDYVTELGGIAISDNPIITGDDCLEIISKDGTSYFHAKNIGTATVTAKDISIAVAIGKARLHIMLVMGQSNAGNHFANAMSDVKCDIGTAYWWQYNAPVTDHTMTTKGWHAPFLAEFRAQSVAAGNPEKPVLIWREGETTRSGKPITAWAPSATNTSGTDGTVKMLQDCISYYTDPIRADKYEIVAKGMYWLQGESGGNPVAYTECFMAMYERLQKTGIEYCAFFRVRQGGDGNKNTNDHNDLSHHGVLRAQLEMINSRDDMYLITDITENWYGVSTAKHSIDISNYITMLQYYGKTASYTDTLGNRALFKDGILTTYMPELYGKNNYCHYGKFGYGIIGADAAYNMYRALYGNDFGIVYSDTSGVVHHQIRAKVGETPTINLKNVKGMLTFRPDCFSTAGTLTIKIASGNDDITNISGMISTAELTYKAISKDKLASYQNVTITVTYTTTAGTTESIVFKIINE